MDAWNVLESGKNWGEADGELCEQLDFINSYVMHIQNLEKEKSWFLQMNLQNAFTSRSV